MPAVKEESPSSSDGAAKGEEQGTGEEAKMATPTAGSRPTDPNAPSSAAAAAAVNDPTMLSMHPAMGDDVSQTFPQRVSHMMCCVVAISLALERCAARKPRQKSRHGAKVANRFPENSRCRSVSDEAFVTFWNFSHCLFHTDLDHASPCVVTP